MTADMTESRGHICDKRGEAGTARDVCLYMSMGISVRKITWCKINSCCKRFSFILHCLLHIIASVDQPITPLLHHPMRQQRKQKIILTDLVLQDGRSYFQNITRTQRCRITQIVFVILRPLVSQDLTKKQQTTTTKHTDTHLNYCAISVVLPVSDTELKPAGINQ